MVFAEFHVCLQHLRPENGKFGANEGRVCVIAEDAAQHDGEAGGGGDDIERLAVGLDDERVGVGVEQCAEREHVGWGLQHPAPRGVTKLQVLEKLPVAGVGRAHVAALKPGAVRGDIEKGVELVAQEGVAHDGDAFLRKLRSGEMDGLEIRREPVEPREIFFRAGDALFYIRFVRRGGIHDLPGERGAVLRVQREQGCAAAVVPVRGRPMMKRGR